VSGNGAVKGRQKADGPTIKPCPYCGGGAALQPMPHSRGWYRVQCLDKDCGGTTWAWPTREGAVATWNRRHGAERDAA